MSKLSWIESVDQDGFPEKFEAKGRIFSLTITWDVESDILPWVVESSTLGDGSSLYHRFNFIHAAKQYAEAQDLREYADLLTHIALLEESTNPDKKETN